MQVSSQTPTLHKPVLGRSWPLSKRLRRLAVGTASNGPLQQRADEAASKMVDVGVSNHKACMEEGIPKLFSPIKLRSVVVKNRIFVRWASKGQKLISLLLHCPV